MAGPPGGDGLRRHGRRGRRADTDDRSPARSLLRGAEDDLAAPQRDDRRRRDDHRRLAPAPPHGRLRDRRHHGLADAAARPRHPHLVGKGVRRLRPRRGDLPEVVGSAQEIGRHRRLRAAAADQRAERRPAGGAGRGALPGTRGVEVHLGTGAFLLANAGPRARRVVGGLAVSVAWQLGDAAAYCIDGQVYAAGAAVAWLQRWGFLRPGRGSRCRGRLGRRRRRGHGGARPQRPGGPWWRPDALASIDGIGPGTEPAHVVRSTVEGLAAQVTLLARAAAVDLGRPLALLRVDGGLTRSRVLMQMQADLLQSRRGRLLAARHRRRRGRRWPGSGRRRTNARRGRPPGPTRRPVRAGDLRRRGGSAAGALVLDRVAPTLVPLGGAPVKSTRSRRAAS